ncbi:uncharacterized protein LOC114517663 [Dendronephthya gigantea]|uniref:uncharacterized protein LOC114517663 n=1 Tax=Dendronephthya gigantea TaxID=151771 RepID=UPI00106CB67C|nr:uncharacterized protein LOC114517663 [Dendronephthya gigantea]
MKEEVTAKRVAVIGGGLAGALNAVYLGTRGYKVDIYESKRDIRVSDKYKGRSINLALSARGLAALENVGLDQMVKESGIPMPGRIIHSINGKTSFIPYGKKGQHLFSISRSQLNKDLLTAAENLPSVDFHCEHKLVNLDIENTKLNFKVCNDIDKEVDADVVFGNDGANSVVRKEIMKRTRLNYSQEYIEHGYKELAMLPKNGEYAMDPNGLHIWPRQTFMMIALPNQDKSFTCTLFMPFEMFHKIITKEDVIAFFKKEFPDSIPLYGEEHLINEYLTNVVGSMISIKCDPYHVEDKVIFFGDAAHAMVPFYGQGMNCALQDAMIFNGLLDEFHDNMGLAMQAFSSSRNLDAKTICDFSMQNYIEMRSLVNSRLFLVRKHVDNFLHWLMPRTFIPKYTMVAFTIIPYHEILARTLWQNKVIDRITQILGVLFVSLGFIITRKIYHRLKYCGLGYIMNDGMETSSKGSVAIVGAGLVGALNAIYLSKRGYTVNVYEARKDVRTQNFFEGRSINLSLSTRGLEALEVAGVSGPILEQSVAMYGRYIHEVSGKTKVMMYGSNGERLLSINRRKLNEYLLIIAESLPNVNLHFEHKLTSIHLNEATMTFTRPNQTTVEVHSKAIIGNDGAYSLIRREMSKQPWYNYKQEYIAHAYQELNIPPKDGEYAMDHRFLHVWPRDSFMLIALPNKDGSFTCTLIMPCKMFDALKTEDDLLTFFKKHFQDTIPLMGEKKLVEKFFSFPPSPMVSVKCSPYHVEDKVIIMGDAAHAMVPFYGQGMNCAFEDSLIFNDFLDKYNDNFGEVFEQFTLTRCPDAHAICDLSYYNYLEMRALLNSRIFFAKTFLIKLLNWLMPRTFIPLYHMVAFSRTPYHKVVSQWKWQDKIVVRLTWITATVPLIAAGVMILRRSLSK